MKKIMSLTKRRGFVFQSSEIYGGVEALWDFGPLGAAMKDNIKKEWMKRFVQQMDNVVAMQGSIVMHPDVWKASGHLENFSDPLVECSVCKNRWRVDALDQIDSRNADGSYMCPTMIASRVKGGEDKHCPGELSQPRQFNLMLKTFLGPVEDEAHIAYLRPETAQSMFTNFKLVQESMRQKIPFGIAQIGKAFRNEITTGNCYKIFGILWVQFNFGSQGADFIA